MSGRARMLARSVGYTAGISAAGSVLAVGVLRAEIEIARRVIGDGPGTSHDDTGSYGAGYGRAYRLLMLGDSTAAGVGAGSPAGTIGATVATGVAALTGRPVEVHNVARSGATSPQLRAQVDQGLAVMPRPDVAVVMIGANDVKERLDRTASARALGDAVADLVAAGAQVVVGTCPDLGTIRPIPQPLRTLVRRWSRQLAAAQTVAVVEAGGRSVSTGDLLGPQFLESPLELFSDDRFHPSAAGYARAAAALLPSVLDALGIWTVDTDRVPDQTRGEGVGPLEVAAERAAEDPGSEVTASEVAGLGRGARLGRLLRRHLPVIGDRGEEPEQEAVSSAAAAPAESADAQGAAAVTGPASS